MFASKKLSLVAILLFGGTLVSASSALIQQSRSQSTGNLSPTLASGSDKEKPVAPSVLNLGKVRGGAEPITIANVHKLGTLTGKKPVATYIEHGPGANELLIY